MTCVINSSTKEKSVQINLEAKQVIVILRLISMHKTKCWSVSKNNGYTDLNKSIQSHYSSEVENSYVYLLDYTLFKIKLDSSEIMESSVFDHWRAWTI